MAPSKIVEKYQVKVIKNMSRKPQHMLVQGQCKQRCFMHVCVCVCVCVCVYVCVCVCVCVYLCVIKEESPGLGM
jgi:hypothetical protein